MRIAQSDLRTVRIEKDALRFYIRYSLRWNGRQRLPESITTAGNNVAAYFLTSTIRDSILETPWGIAVERNWLVVPAGEFTLSFCLDFPDLISAPYYFPCITAGPPASQADLMQSASPPSSAPCINKKQIRIWGEKTSYPCSLFLYAEPCSVMIFTDPPKDRDDSGIIGIGKRQLEDESYLRVELFFPAKEGDTGSFESSGDLERSLRLNLVTASRRDIHQRGIAAALTRSKDFQHPSPGRSEVSINRILIKGTQDCLSTHLYARGGIHGLRTFPDSPLLSSWAGAGLALIINLLFAEDERLRETSLRLADFSLKGQHPSGLFFENFSLEEGAWLGLDRTAPVAVSLGTSAGIAHLLIQLANHLRTRGLQGEKYLGAASRLIQACFDTKKHLSPLGSAVLADSWMPVQGGPEVLGLIGPIWELYRSEGKDYLNKALLCLKNKYYPKSPELPGTLPDSRTALLLAGNALILTEAGFRPDNLNIYFDLLLPWIYINRRALKDSLNTVGGTLDSLSNHRLLFQGLQYSYLLLKLSRLLAHGESKDSAWLETAIAQLMGFTLQKPMGTAYWDSGELGPVGSVRFVREALYLLKIRKEFPEILSSRLMDLPGDRNAPVRAEGPGADL
ncbi:hypothetical protein ES703_36313 [subsurface metagenome]